MIGETSIAKIEIKGVLEVIIENMIETAMIMSATAKSETVIIRIRTARAKCS